MQNERKQMKKRSKFAILAVSVPQVSKIFRNSPYAFILKEKSTQVLKNSKVIKNGLWVKSLENLQDWSLEFGILQKQSLGILKIKKLQIGFWNMEVGNIGPYWYFWGITILVPWFCVNCKHGPCVKLLHHPDP